MTNREAHKIHKEWGGRGFPLVIGKGYTPNFNPKGKYGCRYVIYQWNVHGAIYHANFFFPV